MQLQVDSESWATRCRFACRSVPSPHLDVVVVTLTPTGRPCGRGEARAWTIRRRTVSSPLRADRSVSTGNRTRARAGRGGPAPDGPASPAFARPGALLPLAVSRNAVGLLALGFDGEVRAHHRMGIGWRPHALRGGSPRRSRWGSTPINVAAGARHYAGLAADSQMKVDGERHLMPYAWCTRPVPSGAGLIVDPNPCLSCELLNRLGRRCNRSAWC